MANGNPYYVQPATPDITPLLQGFGSFMQQRQQRRRGQEATTAIQEAIASGDARQVAEVATQYPEFQQSFRDAFGFANQRTQEIATDTYERVLSDPTNAAQYLETGIQQVTEAGGQPIMMTQDLQMFQQNPEQALQKVRMGYAGIAPDRYKAAFGTQDRGLQVKSSDILPDGTTIQVMADGATRVTDPQGNELTGQARADAIRSGQEFGVDIQQRRSQARGVGAMTSKKADALYTQLDKMRANNDNLSELIAEVRGGARTGPLINRLPTLTAATQRLENVKNRLGLDVVGSVTFGALSEKELELARQTAVPDLPPDELVRWAEDKIAANEKLANYLSEQAAFLEQPGNTRSMWADRVRQRKMERETQATETVQTPGGAQTTEAVAGPEGVAVQQTQIQEGTTAINPTTQERIIYRNGQWQPAP